jgi:hypothetical protein
LTLTPQSLVDETLTRKWQLQLPLNRFVLYNLELDKRIFVVTIAAFVVFEFGRDHQLPNVQRFPSLLLRRKRPELFKQLRAGLKGGSGYGYFYSGLGDDHLRLRRSDRHPAGPNIALRGYILTGSGSLRPGLIFFK